MTRDRPTLDPVNILEATSEYDTPHQRCDAVNGWIDQRDGATGNTIEPQAPISPRGVDSASSKLPGPLGAVSSLPYPQIAQSRTPWSCTPFLAPAWDIQSGTFPDGSTSIHHHTRRQLSSRRGPSLVKGSMALQDSDQGISITFTLLVQP